jgi:hypothetical protein
VRRHGIVQCLTIGGELERLVPPLEQRLAGEILECTQPARQRRRAEREFGGSGLGRAGADHADERFKATQGRKAADHGWVASPI